MEKQWYVIHTYSGYENKVKASLERKIESLHLQDKISRIIIPMEDVVEYTKRGEKRIKSVKKYPGYLLVEMALDDQSWYIVRNTQGVASFVGCEAKHPTPLQEQEFEQTMGIGVKKKPKPRKKFEIGESIVVSSGPFVDFNGIIREIYEERGKLKVMLSIFGRETPAELNFEQVKKYDYEKKKRVAK